MGQKENTFVVIIDIAKLPFLGQLHANTNTKLICEDLYFKHVTLGLPTYPHHNYFSFSVLLALLVCLFFHMKCGISLSSCKRKEKKTIYFKISLN